MHTLAPTFDYGALDNADRSVVQQKTTEIRDRMGRAVQNIVEMGERLLVVKDKLGHGQFGAWLDAEFGWTPMTASRMMRAAEFVKSNNLLDSTIAPSALYLLASDSTPDEVRDQFIEAAKNGKPVTHAEVKAAVAPPKPFTQADADRQREELDAIDPLLIKHRERQQEREDEADDDEPEPDVDEVGPAEPKTWNGRVIPADAPPLNVEEAVRNDPGVRWTRLITRLQDCVVLTPDKDTLESLPKDKRKYIRDRMKAFAKHFSEAV